jgi:hypothetical protein
LDLSVSNLHQVKDFKVKTEFGLLLGSPDPKKKFLLLKRGDENQVSQAWLNDTFLIIGQILDACRIS